jgi:hypothetical protein
MEGLTIRDIDAFVHANDHDEPVFVEAIKEDIHDLMDSSPKLSLISKKSILTKLTILIDFPALCNIEDVLAEIVSSGPKILHTFTKESHQEHCIAYKNMLSLAMNIKRE